MKCAKLHLQERLKPKPHSYKLYSNEKPRRYCQKRMVNPDHDEDPRWTDFLERFRCSDICEQEDNTENMDIEHANTGDDLYLSVQNITFQGNSQLNKRPRTSFKYKLPDDNKKHRMFVKQTVDVCEEEEQDRSSHLTSYYFDDYVKYIINDRSRPSSVKDNAVQLNQINESKVTLAEDNIQRNCNGDQNVKNKKSTNKQNKIKIKENEENDDHCLSNLNDTKVAFHKSGKRQSLTISRTQSPETVQVIRVDVVCNYSSSLSNYSDSKQDEKDTKHDTKEFKNLRSSHFAQKYLLTNTVKKLDQNITGGKVTLFCKTFRLSDRVKIGQKHDYKSNKK